MSTVDLINANKEAFEKYKIQRQEEAEIEEQTMEDTQREYTVSKPPKWIASGSSIVR